VDILGLGYLGLESSNAKAWIDYGPEVLGFSLNESRNNENVYLRMDDRHHRIVVREGPNEGVQYIGWEARHRIAFEEAIAKLRAKGVEVTMGDDALAAERAVLEVAQFADPAGFQHELFYGQYFDPGSFMPGRPHSGFVAEEKGLGHVVLLVPELTKELDSFYRDVLEFRWFGHGVSKGIGYFYRTKLSNSSHNIALIGVPGMRGLHHIGIEVKELDDVGIAYDRSIERDIPIHMTMGRHTQDPVVSFYGFTATGGLLEYIWGAPEMPEETFYERAAEKLSVWGHKLVVDGLPNTVGPVGA
jgi:2,3-dihydroxybiphenyl 1,2-dioxygenase